MEYLINIFLGVIAGILTYIAIEITLKVFKDTIVPWYQTKIYKGHNINGEWYGYGAIIDSTGEYISQTESESLITIKQRGDVIKGELLLTMQPTGEKCKKMFEFYGNFVDTILVVTTKVRDSNSMGTGGIIMKLTENGTKLKGKHTYVSSHDWATVASREQVWVRKII